MAGLNAFPVQPGKILPADRNSTSPSGAGVFGEIFIDPKDAKMYRFVVITDGSLVNGQWCRHKDNAYPTGVTLSSVASGVGEQPAGAAYITGGLTGTVGQGIFVQLQGQHTGVSGAGLVQINDYVDPGATDGVLQRELRDGGPGSAPSGASLRVAQCLESNDTPDPSGLAMRILLTP